MFMYNFCNNLYESCASACGACATKLKGLVDECRGLAVAPMQPAAPANPIAIGVGNVGMGQMQGAQPPVGMLAAHNFAAAPPPPLHGNYDNNNVVHASSHQQIIASTSAAAGAAAELQSRGNKPKRLTSIVADASVASGQAATSKREANFSAEQCSVEPNRIDTHEDQAERQQKLDAVASALAANLFEPPPVDPAILASATAAATATAVPTAVSAAAAAPDPSALLEPLAVTETEQFYQQALTNKPTNSTPQMFQGGGSGAAGGAAASVKKVIVVNQPSVATSSGSGSGAAAANTRILSTPTKPLGAVDVIQLTASKSVSPEATLATKAKANTETVPRMRRLVPISGIRANLPPVAANLKSQFDRSVGGGSASLAHSTPSTGTPEPVSAPVTTRTLDRVNDAAAGATTAGSSSARVREPIRIFARAAGNGGAGGLPTVQAQPTAAASVVNVNNGAGDASADNAAKTPRAGNSMS